MEGRNNSSVTDRKNNVELLNLLETRPDLNERRLRTMMGMTGYKKATVCAWFADVNAVGFRPMPNLALRLFKLEIGVTKPRYLKGTKLAA